MYMCVCVYYTYMYVRIYVVDTWMCESSIMLDSHIHVSSHVWTKNHIREHTWAWYMNVWVENYATLTFRYQPRIYVHTYIHNTHTHTYTYMDYIYVWKIHHYNLYALASRVTRRNEKKSYATITHSGISHVYTYIHIYILHKTHPIASEYDYNT